MTAPITIDVVSASVLRKDESDEIVSLCSAAYGIDFAPIIQSYGDPITHVRLRVGGLLVSHALWIPRWLQVGDGPLMRTAYVEAVATAKAHRRRGHAAAVLRRLAQELADFEIGALSPADPRFYFSSGWELWKGPLLIRKEDKLLEAPANDQAMILRLPRTPQLDLKGPLSVEWREGEVW